MDNPATRQVMCTSKTVSKFCLMYLTALMLLVLIFVAVSCDPLEPGYLIWWWGFILSLLFACAATTSALVILICSDYKKVAENSPQHDVSDRTTIPNQDENSGSLYKTVLTINSTPEQSLKLAKSPPLQPTLGEVGGSSFVNLTPPNTKSHKFGQSDHSDISLRQKDARAKSERYKVDRDKDKAEKERILQGRKIEDPSNIPTNAVGEKEPIAKKKPRKKYKNKLKAQTPDDS